MPALAAGILAYVTGVSSCTADKLPRGSMLGGVAVGGLTREEAVARFEEVVAEDLADHRLEIVAEDKIYPVAPPQLSFKDNALNAVNYLSEGGSAEVEVSYYIEGLESIISGICAAHSVEMKPSQAVFNGGEGQPFYYKAGQDGVSADGDALMADILASLAGRRLNEEFERVYLHTMRVPAVSVEELKENTALVSAFTTYFDGANVARADNIRLSGGKISGCVLQPGKSFSFNGVVGERTAANGFKEANIISNGQFVKGIGGGVCQTSTTLYNAALLAGLKVTEYHPHSLAVAYVSPSRDAMVSGNYSDLQFENVTDCPVYIRVLTGENYIRCEIYGRDYGVKYSLESDYSVTEDGGVESSCHIIKTSGGQTTRTLLRKDSYKPTKGAADQP